LAHQSKLLHDAGWIALSDLLLELCLVSLGLGSWGFSPLIQLGQTSLLVYWVHIEFVYGRFSLLPKRAQSITGASRGLVEIFLFMLILSLLRTRIDWKKMMGRVRSV